MKFNRLFLLPLTIIIAVGCNNENKGDPSSSNLGDDILSNLETSSKLLALETSGKIAINEDDHTEILNQLIVLRSTYPEIPDVYAHKTWSLDTLFVSLTDAAEEQFTAGSFTEWDLLNNQYNLSHTTEFSMLPNLHLLHFDGEYNMALLKEEYLNLSGVESAEENRITGNSSDICLEKGTDHNYYIFYEGSGDCAAGCINRSYIGFTIDQNYNANKIGEHIHDWTNPTQPEWLTDRHECWK